MLPRHRQPDAPVPAHRRLLAHVGPAGRHAATLALARRPVRYAAPAPDQARRQGRSAEAQAAAPPAALDPEPADLRLRVDPAVSHAHLRPGGNTPRIAASDQPPTPPPLSPPNAEARRANPCRCLRTPPPVRPHA